MVPIVHGLEKRYSERVDFLYLDVEDSATTAAKSRLGFRATPHFFLLAADGTVLGEWQGVQARSVLEEALRAMPPAAAADDRS
jgi:thioredoxin-like negative regulator of GroEL